MTQQIVTATFFYYQGLWPKIWAFSQMGIMPRRLKQVQGLQFFKLMGSGAGHGFSLKPDFSTYCLLGVWDDKKRALAFFEQHPAYQTFQAKSFRQQTFYLKATQVKGFWNQKQPFDLNTVDPQLPFAVLTRASISRKRLVEFWRYVPANEKAIHGAKGLLFSKGVGELPLVEQATLSIWENKEAMMAFAYQNPIHRETIRLTHARNWYSEEMFAEFNVLESIEN